MVIRKSYVKPSTARPLCCPIIVYPRWVIEYKNTENGREGQLRQAGGARGDDVGRRQFRDLVDSYKKTVCNNRRLKG